MTFGVMLSLWNKMARHQYSQILLEFLPQIVFLLGIFGYLILVSTVLLSEIDLTWHIFSCLTFSYCI